MALEIFALIVMLVIVAVVIWLVVLLGSMPGKIARQRGHPQADAIQVLGWIGVVTLGVGWFVALVWAYLRPNERSELESQLVERITALESQLSQPEAEGDQS